MIKANSQHLIVVLIPSILSGSITAAASVMITGFAVVASYGSTGVLRQGLFAASSLTAPTYQQVTNRLAQNTFVSNIPLLLFWVAVGVIIYLCAINIVTAFGNGVDLEEKLNYVNSQRSKLIRYEIILVFIRAAILVGWLVYVQLFIRLLLPYVLAAEQAARLSGVLSGIGQIALAASVLFISIHIHLVFLRLLLLKTRVFADKDDI